MVPVTSWGSLDAAQTWTLGRLSEEGDLRMGGSQKQWTEGSAPAAGGRQPLGGLASQLLSVAGLLG